MQEVERKTNNSQQLQELRAKIHLSDGQRKAMYEELERTRKKNEDKIRQLQEEVWFLQQSKLKDKRMGEKVYWKLANDKTLARLFINKNPEKVKEELEHRIFMIRKERDNLRFTRKKKAQRLKISTKDALKDYKLGVKEITYTDVRKMKYYETCIAQLKIKTDEANYIKQLYNNIISKLQEEERMFGQRLKRMEDDLLKYIAETQRIHQVEAIAKKLRDDIIRDITSMEWKLHKAKAVHEENTKEFNSQIEEEKEEIKKASKRKSVPYSIKMWEDLLNQIKDPSKIAAEEKQLASFIELFDEVRDKTGIATAEDLVNLHRSQKRTRQFLKEKEQNLLAQLTMLNQQKNELEMQLEELNFKENQKYFGTFQLIKKCEDEIHNKEKEIILEEQHLEEITTINSNMKTVLEDIFSKFDGIKGYNGINIPEPILQPEDENYLQQLIEACAAKVLALQKNYDEQDSDIILVTPTPHELNHLKDKELFIPDELELNLEGMYNKFLTRNLIKQMSKQIVECQAKLKKRLLYNIPESKSTQKKKTTSISIRK